MRKRLSLAALAGAAFISTTAQAGTIFAQDFSGGLTGRETLGGDFTVGGGQVGHTDGGYGNFEYSYYQLSLDLTDWIDAQLAFDYSVFSEAFYDGFNVLASTDGAFTPANLITPVSTGFYGPMINNLPNLGRVAVSGQSGGSALFDLTSFAGGVVDLRFQFQSDYSNFARGVLIDNVAVTGTPDPSAVPEPAAWALMILGFGAAGTMLRRRRAIVL